MTHRAALAIGVMCVVLAGNGAHAQVPVTVQRGVPQVGVPQVGVPQTGIPQIGRAPAARPQVNPDGSRPRIVPGWHPPVTVIVGDPGNGYVSQPWLFNLPNPGAWHYWQKVGNDAVLIERRRGTIIQVRNRWFG